MTDSDYILRLMLAERAAVPPSGAAKAGLQRLFASLATPAAPLPIAVGSLKLGWGLIAKWVGVGFVVGTAGAGLGTYTSHAANSPVVAPARAALAATSPARAGVIGVAPPALAAPAAPAPTPTGSKLGVSGTAAVVTAVAAVSPTFDEELRLITAAKHELNAGRAAVAQSWLDEHRQRFPRGVFSAERAGLLVLANCNGSPNPRLAREFASQHPDSPMLEQLLRRCGVESSDGARGPAIGNFANVTNETTPLAEPIKD